MMSPMMMPMMMPGGPAGGAASPGMSPADAQKMQMQQQQMMQMMMASMCMPMMMVPAAMVQGQGGAVMGAPGAAGGMPAATAPSGPSAADKTSDKMEKYQKLVKRKQKDNANVVFVGGLRKTTEEDRVCAHFAKFGQVDHVDIKRLPDGTSRGFAFVKFTDSAAVDKVIEAHAKHMIDNKWVEVKRHDGMAACAGMASTLQKKMEEQTTEEKEEPVANQEDYEEQFSQQYLQMAQQLGTQQQEKQTDQQKQLPQQVQQAQQMQQMQQQMQQMMMGGGMGSMPMMMMPMDPSMMMGMMNPAMMQAGMANPSAMMNPMATAGQAKTSSGKPQAIGALPDAGRSPSRSRSRSSSRSSSRSRSLSADFDRPREPSPSFSRAPPPPPTSFPALAPPPGMSVGQGLHPGGGGSCFSGTLSSMLSPGGRDDSSQGVATESEAAKAAARAAAAAVAGMATKVAAQNLDAAREAREAAKVAAASAHSMHGQCGGEGEDMPARLWHPDPSNPQLKPPMKLWLPKPSAPEPPPPDRPPPPAIRGRPEPAPEARPRPVPEKPRSRSRNRGRRSRSAPRRSKRGGWDNEEAPPTAIPSMAPPSRPALPPGVTEVVPGGAKQWAGHVQVNRFGVPEATREALAAAVIRAQQVEAAGLQNIRETGQIPRGPPDLPTGTEVIEQKCVAYLIGKGGQALAAINAAAGVSIQIDQSTKTFGWSMANIYGTEEGAVKAKMILRQKISEYRPLRG